MNMKGLGRKWLRSISRYYLGIHLKGLREITKISVRDMGVLIEIQTGCLRNTRHKCHHLSQLAQFE
jgi:hypothetical protein